MLVQRSVFSIKPGASDEIVELLKPYLKREENGLKRVLVPKVAPAEHVVLEWEWESLAAMEQGWDEWRDEPETPEFLARWLSLITQGGAAEVWEVAEIG